MHADQSLHCRFKSHLKEGMQARTLPLSMLPSLVHATSHRKVLLTNDYEASVAESDELRFEDWELQHSTAGVRSFMMAPLLFAGQVRSIDLGAAAQHCECAQLHEPPASCAPLISNWALSKRHIYRSYPHPTPSTPLPRSWASVRSIDPAYPPVPHPSPGAGCAHHATQRAACSEAGLKILSPPRSWVRSS